MCAAEHGGTLNLNSYPGNRNGKRKKRLAGGLRLPSSYEGPEPWQAAFAPVCELDPLQSAARARAEVPKKQLPESFFIHATSHLVARSMDILTRNLAAAQACPVTGDCPCPFPPSLSALASPSASIRGANLLHLHVALTSRGPFPFRQLAVHGQNGQGPAHPLARIPRPRRESSPPQSWMSATFGRRNSAL